MANQKITSQQWIGISCLSLVAAIAVNHFCALAATKNNIINGLTYASNNFLDFSKTGLLFGSDITSIAASIMTFVLIIYAFVYSKAKGTFRRGQEHGSSVWATQDEMAAFGDKDNPANNVIFSQHARMRYRRGNDHKHERNRNVLVVGGSGSGKTRGYIKPNLMQIPSAELAPHKKTNDNPDHYARSYLVTDPKGTTRVETGHLFAEHGYIVKEFNTIDWAASMHYNPIKYINNEEDVITFATCLIANTTPPKASSSDPFWEKSETLLYQALINYMRTEVPEEDRNLITLCELLDLGEIDTQSGALSGLDILFLELETGKKYSPPTTDSGPLKEGTSMKYGTYSLPDPWKDSGHVPQPNHPAVLAYNSFKSGAAETLQSIFISCKVRLAPLRTKQVKEVLSDDEMELDKFGDQKMICYAIPSATDSTFNFLFALLIWQMLNQLTVRATIRYGENGGALPVGVDLLLDEAANFFVPNLQKTISVVRSYNIGITMVLQSLNQLKSIYNDDAATIIDCCDTMIFLGGKSGETNKKLEEQMGQETVTTDNTSKTHATQASWSQQIAQHGRALMQASEIAKMPSDECLVLISGANPFKDKKYDLTSHPLYKYVDCGKHPKDQFCSRGFDFTAYKSNKKYYEKTHAQLELSVKEHLFTSYPVVTDPPRQHWYTVMLQFFVKNSGTDTAYNIHGGIESTIACLSNQDQIRFPRVEPFGTVTGLSFERSEARTNKMYLLPNGDSAKKIDYIDWFDPKKRYNLLSTNLAPDDTIIYTIAIRVSKNELLSKSFDSHGYGTCDELDLDLDETINFTFKNLFMIQSANCDSIHQASNIVLSINPFGFAELHDTCDD